VTDYQMKVRTLIQLANQYRMQGNHALADALMQYLQASANEGANG
jgi:hypothetical protein